MSAKKNQPADVTETTTTAAAPQDAAPVDAPPAEEAQPPEAAATKKVTTPKTPDYSHTRVLSVTDYPPDTNRRKHWEIDIALRTLRALGAVTPESIILGVGAGVEPTMFQLTNEVKMVFATDLYADAGVWAGTAPKGMLVDPTPFAPNIPWERQRLAVLHRDGRALYFPEAFFDGIFSSGSIEHFGSFTDVARAAAEIGRVLKPGGIASISTEFKVSGDGHGWPGVLLFTPDELIEHIVKPSGLTLVGEPQWEVDAATLDTAYSLESIVNGRVPPVEGALTYQNYTFTSVHLALRKD